ncbi:MAG: phosphonate transport system substrate-binding protein [Candidatus Krumholzibacteriia bacterium]|jgi:phosphonate transport system substrate-binding protein
MFYRIAMAVLCLAITAGCGQTVKNEDKPVLRFAAIPDQNTTELQQRLAPLVAHLSEQLGVEVEYVPARDYQASVEMFRNADVQLAWFGGLTGVQARAAVPGARAIAQGAADPEYYSYVIANESTGIERSDEFPHAIAQHTFTFGSPSSTSGRLMPEYFIRQATGKGPDEFFQSPVGYSGSHDKTCEWVESGQFEVGVVNYKVYDRRVANGDTDPEVCRIIWKTPFYADYNFTAHPSLEETFGEGFTAKLQAVLLAIDDPALLSALPRRKLIAAQNEDFDGIAKVAKDLDMVR